MGYALGKEQWHVSCFIELTPMKEIKSGCLMLLVCAALYIQVDPRFLNGVCQLIARLMVGWH
jgi:hypothetical protein